MLCPGRGLEGLHKRPLCDSTMDRLIVRATRPPVFRRIWLYDTSFALGLAVAILPVSL
jgi:hypothetical protein